MMPESRFDNDTTYLLVGEVTKLSIGEVHPSLLPSG
jgi:hypothetical protein